MGMQAVLPAPGNRVVPLVHLAAVVITLLPAQRHVEVRYARVTDGQLLQQRQAHLGQLGLVVFLVRQQNQIGPADRMFRFTRQVPGVARADAHQKQLQHQAPSVPAGKRGSSPRGR
jgi:hypothetical protein